MMKAIKEYIKEETAEEGVQFVVLAVLGLSCAVAIGWWVWSVLEKQTNASKCGGKNANPFCIE